MISDLRIFLLLKLMEECDEASQRASKAMQYGYMEIQEGQGKTNRDRLIKELDDIMAVIEFLNEDGLNYKPDPVAIEDKREKIKKFLKYSIKLGQVDPKVLEDFNGL